MEEINFWNERAAALQFLRKQLQEPFVGRVMSTLEESGSTYLPAFRVLLLDVQAAETEAQDNTKYLAILQPW